MPREKGPEQGTNAMREPDAPASERHCSISGTNFADVAVVSKGGATCVTVATDNLGKGMAGTAVQNVNLLFGLPETAGLLRPGAGL